MIRDDSNARGRATLNRTRVVVKLFSIVEAFFADGHGT